MKELTVSSVCVRIGDVTIFVDDGVDPGAGAVRWEVSPRVLHVVSTIVGDDLPFEYTICHRTEHLRTRIVCGRNVND